MYRVSIEFNKNTSGSLGEREMPWKHEPQVFPQLFRILPNFHECFYNSISERKNILRIFLRIPKPTCGLR